MIPANLQSFPKLLLLALFSSALILGPTFYLLAGNLENSFEHNAKWAPGSVGRKLNPFKVNSGSSEGGETIMGKMGNATAKAEVGRASWRLLHTMAARYPEHPTDDEKQTYRDFLHLFSRLYPCGECSAEFILLLKQYPPQVSSRKAASNHLCHLHNQVNLRLKKPEFDCTNLEGIYDCGCGPKPEGETEGEEQKDVVRDEVTGMELIGG